MADQAFNLGNASINRLALTHDRLEDTKSTQGKIESQFGRLTAIRTLVMTEDKRISDYLTRLIAFIRQLETGDDIVACTEILDRLDELCSLAYVLVPLTKDSPEKTAKRLARKFAKCLFMVQEVARGKTSAEITLLIGIFQEVYDYQKNILQPDDALIDAWVSSRTSSQKQVEDMHSSFPSRRNPSCGLFMHRLSPRYQQREAREPRHGIQLSEEHLQGRNAPL